ncbi:MAG TPA: hypothetical protein VIE69_07935 [Methylophilaceae bacterium]|jgi:hypothetical protein
MKLFLIIAGVAIMAFGLWSGSHANWQVLTVSFLGFCVLLFVANLDRIAEFKASSTGIEAKTREVIAKAEDTLNELQILATQVGALTLSLVKRSGRIGGYAEEEQMQIKDNILAVLKQLGVKESEHPELLTEWHKFTEFDYFHGIIGNSRTPINIGPEAETESILLLGRGLENIPSPAEIEAFLSKHSLMNEVKAELLKDYEHYRNQKVHRRPEVWKDRKNWGPLQKPHA